MKSDPLSNQKRLPCSSKTTAQIMVSQRCGPYLNLPIFFCLGIQWEDSSFGKEYLDFVLDQDKDFSGIKVKKELSDIYDCVRFYQNIYCI